MTILPTGYMPSTPIKANNGLYTVAIIQARLGSKRFPKKIMEDLCGEPMIVRIIERVKQALCTNGGLLDHIIVATPDGDIASIAQQHGVWGYVGDEDDVLGRYVEAAHFCNPDVIVRITADCPLIDAEVINQCIRNLEMADYSSNVLNRTFPKGLDTEVLHKDVLTRLDRVSTLKEREHVTLNIKNNREHYITRDVMDTEDFKYLNWCVDEPEDILYIRKIYEWMNGKYRSYKEILEVFPE